MRRSTNSAWLTKLMVSMARKRGKVPQRHMQVKERLALNRGKALGYPKPTPKTRYQQRVENDRSRRWIKAMLTDF